MFDFCFKLNNWLYLLNSDGEAIFVLCILRMTKQVSVKTSNDFSQSLQGPSFSFSQNLVWAMYGLIVCMESTADALNCLFASLLRCAMKSVLW
jgi:hypothetical protein